jgi:hypothetical protein
MQRCNFDKTNDRLRKVFMKRFLLVFLLVPVFTIAFSQQDRWQQRISYNMDVKLNVVTNKLNGTQKIEYYNNSFDTLNKIFVHLYWNAFKPGSMMDESSRSTETLVLGNDRKGNPVTDFDRRFKKKIATLTPDEQGYCNVSKFVYNGHAQKVKMHETILEVDLDKPILPRSMAAFTTEFECQVPKLSRRAGRDNEEGVRYSMGQWYPKISEYDEQGWHPDNYIRGEFYGVWGDYNVNITIDKNYKLGASGILQNAAAIGWGYDKEGTPLKPATGDERTWRFSAKNVHDFVWAADPEYKHVTRQVPNGPLLHFIYKNDPAKEAGWQATADSAVMVYPFIAKTFGPYAYPVYSFLQGGGGGTEYPMATLMKSSSFPTALHEWCHSWYQMMLGTNENLYAWMDEGFADYAEARTFAWLHKTNFFAHAPEYESYFNLVKSGYDEPMSTPANFYKTNLAYNVNAYYKGAIFLRQLGYIVGESNIDKIMLQYYRQWRFKHPTPNDFMRVAEKATDMQLQWYGQFMVNTTKTVDYAIDSLWDENGKTNIRVKRIGEMPMPIDVQLTFKDGSKELHYIPLNLMYGEKAAESDTITRTVDEEWRWTQPTYVFQTSRKLFDLSQVEIDPTQRMADIDRRNNLLKITW